MITEISLTLEQEDFLKENGFHLVYGEDRFYVSGKIGREVVEMYNMESIETVLAEMETGRYTVNSSKVDSDITSSDLWEINRSSIINPSKELKITKLYLGPKKMRLAISENDYSITFIGRTNEGRQAVVTAYKTVDAAETAAIPHIIKEINLLENHIEKLKSILTKASDHRDSIS